MAEPITWRNVGVENTMGANLLMNQSNEQKQAALQGLQQIFGNIRQNNINAADANTQGQIDWFQQQARGLDPKQLTPEQRQTLLNGISDPLARTQAAKDWGVIADETLTRNDKALAREELGKEYAQNALLRPLEVAKEKQAIETDKAQAASALASAASARSTAALNQYNLTTAQKAQKKQEVFDSVLTAAFNTGDEQTGRQVILNSGLPGAEQAKAIAALQEAAKVKQSVTLDQQQEADKTLKAIDSKYVEPLAKATEEAKRTERDYPIDPVLAQPMTTQQFGTKIVNLVAGAGDTWYTNWTDRDDLKENILAGQKQIENGFPKLMQSYLMELGMSKVGAEQAASQMNHTGVINSITSMAIDRLNSEKQDDGTVYKLDDTGNELFAASAPVIRAYAVNYINQLKNDQAKTQLNEITTAYNKEKLETTQLLNERFRKINSPPKASKPTK